MSRPGAVVGGARSWFGAAAAALLVGVTLALVPAGGAVAGAPAHSAPGGRLLFVPNVGQFPAAVRYQILGGRTTAWLTQDSLWLTALAPSPAADLARTAVGDAPRRTFVRGVNIRIAFAGIEPNARMVATDPRPTRLGSFLGDDTGRWRSGVPSFGAVTWRGAYLGTTLELRALDGRLAVVVDAADPAALARVRLQIEGAGAVGWRSGALVAHTPLGDVVLPPIVAGGASPKALGATIRGGAVSFAPKAGGAVPGTPVASRMSPGGSGLLYGTYLGGTDDDRVFDLARGADGSTYVVGQTFSADFPTTPGAFDTHYHGGGGFDGDVFVSKLDPTGSTLVWSTFLGGSDTDYGLAIAVGPLGGVVVAGYTHAPDFPTTRRSFQPTFAGGCCDAFVTKLNAEGGKLVYSTFLGGSSFEEITALALGPNRSIHVTGQTLSPDFPTTEGAFDRTMNKDGNGGYADAFVAELDTQARTLVHSTFLGGKYNDIGEAIALGRTGEEYVAGSTQSPNFPTTRHAFDRTFNGGGSGDAFVTRLAADGSRPLFSTYLGGSDDDDTSAVAVGRGGRVYVAGTTSSSDFPTTPGAYDTSINSFIFSDLFATELEPDGRSLAFSTFIGGNDSDIAGGMALDDAGDVTLTGTTYSDNFPTTGDAFQGALGGPADALVSRLDPTGSTLSYSTYLGGTGSVIDTGSTIWISAPDAVSVAGSTHSGDFPTTPGAYDTTYDGGFDGFVVTLSVGSVG